MRSRPLALATLIAACGGAQVEGGVDYRAMIRGGHADEAVAALERETADHPDDVPALRLLFLAHAAAWAKATPSGERPALDAGRRRKAEDALDRAARIEGPGVALRRALADAVPTGLVSTRTGHVALASLALAWVTERWATRLSPTPDGAEKRALTQGGLGLLGLVADAAEAGVTDEEAVRGPLDAGSSLLDAGSGGLAFASDTASAWAVYLAAARAAVALARSSTPPPAAADALLVALVALERNPDLALPAACDLASPIADLRHIAARDLERIRRLETAVEPAAGCTPGTYAPPP